MKGPKILAAALFAAMALAGAAQAQAVKVGIAAERDVQRGVAY